MAGKRGMNHNGNMGGTRTPKGGRPKNVYWFRAEKGQKIVIERETIGGEIAPPVVYDFLDISENGSEMTLQNGNEILTVRRASEDD